MTSRRLVPAGGLGAVATVSAGLPAAAATPNVKALVFIGGFAPREGEPVVAINTRCPGSRIEASTLDLRPLPLPEGGSGVDACLTPGDVTGRGEAHGQAGRHGPRRWARRTSRRSAARAGSPT